MEIILGGNYPRWELAGWELAGWELAGWELSRVGIIQVGIIQVGVVLTNTIFCSVGRFEKNMLICSCQAPMIKVSGRYSNRSYSNQMVSKFINIRKTNVSFILTLIQF